MSAVSTSSITECVFKPVGTQRVPKVRNADKFNDNNRETLLDPSKSVKVNISLNLTLRLTTGMLVRSVFLTMVARSCRCEDRKAL